MSDADQSTNLSKRIKQLREEAGINKAGLARRIGVSDVSVHYWESGAISHIRHNNLERLARVFGLTVSELLNEPEHLRWEAQVAARTLEEILDAIDTAETVEEVQKYVQSELRLKRIQANSTEMPSDTERRDPPQE